MKEEKEIIEEENNELEEFKKLLGIKKKRTVDDEIEDILIENANYLAYKFFKSKKGQKIVDKLYQKVIKELKENGVPEVYYKREIDRIINYKITIKAVFQKSFPLFLKWITKIEKRRVFLKFKENVRK